MKTLNVLQKLKGVKIENGNENVNLPSEAAALVEEKNLPDPEGISNQTVKLTAIKDT